MKYANYRQWRDDVVTSCQNLHRLDCMNPGKALTSWVNASDRTKSRRRQVTPEDIIKLWAGVTNQTVSLNEVVTAQGVRELLGATFFYLSKHASEFWFPEDVYPVYFDLAKKAHIFPKVFQTLPEIQWSFLKNTSKQAVILLPIPLMPLGRWPLKNDIAFLVQWLREAKDRALLVDAVYTYDFSASREILEPLLATGKCAVFWSCSKSWISDAMLGIARMPKTWIPSIKDHVLSPPSSTLEIIYSILDAQPTLPLKQEKAFQREWERLSVTIKSITPKWQAPGTGYFSPVDISYETLLREHNILSVPASVFGSKREDLSILSCLYDLVDHEASTNDPA